MPHCPADTVFLPKIALPMFDKDVGAPAFVIGEEKQNILLVTRPPRVMVPLWVVDHESWQKIETLGDDDTQLRRLADEVRLSMLRQMAVLTKALRDAPRDEETPPEAPVIVLVIRDMPSVTFEKMTASDLRLTAQLKAGLLLSWGHDPTGLPEQFPFEPFLPTDPTYYEEDTKHPPLHPLSGIAIDWSTAGGRQMFAAGVERKLREDFFGPAILEGT